MLETAFLRLPLTFDPGSLGADMAECLRQQWPGHFNQRDYAGEWTSIETVFVVDGHRLTMQPGECRYADFGLPDSVRNDGATGRAYLVIDGLRNCLVG